MRYVAVLLVLLFVFDSARAQKRESPPVRVLLFAGAPTREYQFLRTILARDPKTVYLITCLQTGDLGSDEDPDLVLKVFPLLNSAKDKGRAFDLIIAFDADWSAVPAKHLHALNAWVKDAGGGLILVAGPTYTFRLARPGGLDLAGLTSLLPVKLKDNRLHGVIPRSTPCVLRLTDAALPVFHLEPKDKSAMVGWDRFFWNGNPPRDMKLEPARGFYSYYPVESIAVGAKVLANLVDARGKEYPYVVAATPGDGKTLFIGSGEWWRLRAVDTAYHEQLWRNFIAHAAGKPGPYLQQSWLGAPLQAIEGEGFKLEARLMDGKGKPIVPAAKPVVRVVRDKQAAIVVAMTPRTGRPGWYDAVVPTPTAGDYALTIEAHGIDRPMPAVVQVKALFEIYVSEGVLRDRQSALARRGLEWAQAVLKLSVQLAAEKSDKGFLAESKVFRDAVDGTVNQSWVVHQTKMETALWKMQRDRLDQFQTALDESKAIEGYLRAMRTRLIGKDRAQETLAILRSWADAERELETSLEKAQSAVVELNLRLGRLRLLVQTADEAASREALPIEEIIIDELAKQVRGTFQDLKAASERNEKAMAAVRSRGIRPTTLRFFDTHHDTTLRLQEKNHLDAVSLLASLKAAKGKGGYDVAALKKTVDRFADLNTSFRSLRLVRSSEVFLELMRLEAEQAEQTRVLTVIHRQVQAEVLKRLLDDK